ncbi:MAG: hypothetical protein COV52_02775 [Gammaproteobacteria bacterium CG11_big_fil_rev_8_21_14_0_20_46_22]|nr:MAG: hypothetical protein COW05_08810 [Gammaproteobacteria bacterium CG12_big_fil_rev_8_21_14_0_65_46_12]PIR11701.1 MAG: hypothetical protein COV52_02775 [Gammaproteobacteria bacterium CG11_big_fil_rev_8_21_14_0_20_46_22]
MHHILVSSCKNLFNDTILFLCNNLAKNNIKSLLCLQQQLLQQTSAHHHHLYHRLEHFPHPQLHHCHHGSYRQRHHLPS